MHTQMPDEKTEARDQLEFDQAVAVKGKLFLQVVAGLGIVAALLVSALALSRGGEGHTASAVAQPAAKQAAATAPASAASAATVKTVDVKVIGAYKLAADGKKHDAFTKTEFAVKVGQPLKLRIDNTDDVAHSITSPVAGVNIVAQPGTHTYTLIVKTAGRYQWYCMIPCDSDANGWAMSNPGFMSGYITAT